MEFFYKHHTSDFNSECFSSFLSELSVCLTILNMENVVLIVDNVASANAKHTPVVGRFWH